MPGKHGSGAGKRKHGKGASKGLRWAKGHSCVSNPTTRKFRDQASSGFLHPVSENPLFTVKNVAAIPTNGDGSDMEEDLSSDVGSLTISDASCRTGLSSISTLRSLSSAWSKCSTNAFDRFLKRFKSDSIVHKEMLSILAASSEVINGAGGKLNETEFFATFITLLDSCQPDQYQPLMSLVSIIISRVTPNVLKLRFGDIYPKIGSILSYALENNNDSLIRVTIEALTKLIRIQDTLNLEEDKQLQALFYTILKCTLHEKPRVRKKSRSAVRRLVLHRSTSESSLIKLTLGWVLDQLGCYPTCETKVVADVLSLLLCLWTAVSNLSKPGAKKLFEGVLRVMSSGDSSIMKIGLSFFVEVFENVAAISEGVEREELFSKLIVALWELQPDTRNTDCFILWLRCILSGLTSLRQASPDFDQSFLASSLEVSSPVWITNHGKTISQLYKDFFPHLITEATDKAVLEKCFRVLSKNLLSVPPNIFALQILENLLANLTPDFYCTSAKDIFLQLIPLRNAQGVVSALGKFIRAFGIEKLWTAVDPATRWLVVLPLVCDNLHNCKISFWKTEILPGITTESKMETAWAALVGFCRNPVDPENFPAELIGKTIVEKPKVRLQALAAIRQFVDWAQCNEIAKKYSKNYLPILFNLYIQTKPKLEVESLKGHADSVGVTIQKYLEHCDEQFINELAQKALVKLSNEVDEAASPVFDLVAFLAIRAAQKELQDKILDVTSKKWAKTGDSKRVYRIMTALSKNKDLHPDILLKLMETLKETKAETKSNAAALRLECISEMTMRNTEWFKHFLPEVIINILSVNAKAKKLAWRLTSDFSKYLKESKQSFDSVLEIIQVGLSSPIPLMVSSTLRFSCLVYRELTPEQPNQQILQHCINHLLNHPDPNVWKFCLQFLTLNLQLYKGALGLVAKQLGVIVSDTKYPKKDSTRLLARMIKVFGAVGVKAVVVDAEDKAMRNRIKNICKKLREKKKKEDKIEEDDDDDEEDESGDDMDIDVRMSNKTPLVMKEGVVDFLNPSDIAKSLINERSSKPEEEFKMNEDGKLIIDIDEPKSGRKRSAPKDSDDETSDDDEDDFEKPKQNKNSSASMKSGRSRFSSKSSKSVATSASKFSRSNQKSKGRKGEDVIGDRKKRKAKRFKSSASVKSSRSGKSRKSSAASTFRLRM